MLRYKLLAIATLCPTLTVTTAHYASHSYVKLETRAITYLTQQKERALEALISFKEPSREIGAKILTIKDVIKSEAQKHNLKPELIESIIEIESNWKPNAIRFEPHLAKGTTDQARMQASSHGLMQILPLWCGDKTCPTVHTWADLYNPIKNIQCGTAILAQALKESGSVHGALIAYNGGINCKKNPVCLAQARVHAGKVMQALAEKMLTQEG